MMGPVVTSCRTSRSSSAVKARLPTSELPEQVLRSAAPAPFWGQPPSQPAKARAPACYRFFGPCTVVTVHAAPSRGGSYDRGHPTQAPGAAPPRPRRPSPLILDRSAGHTRELQPRAELVSGLLPEIN